jgi:hypothetical protein
MKTNLENIIHALEIRRDNLDAAIAALTGHKPVRHHSTRLSAIPAGAKALKRRRRLSAAAKKRISEGMRARWAKAKESGKNAL